VVALAGEFHRPQHYHLWRLVGFFLETAAAVVLYQ
jgi:hypothetical protein